MEYYNEYSNTNIMNHTSKFYYVKKLTQILLSMSLFSFLISQSSFAPIIVDSYDYFVPKISINLFTCTTERNCIFLLCNGILVLIIQTSGLISKITPVQSSTKGTGIDDHRHAENIESGPRFQEKKTAYVRKFDAIEEEEREIVAAEVDSKEDYTGINNQEWDYDDDEDEEEDGIDELNKKCEDFIKKMKQEIQGTSI